MAETGVDEKTATAALEAANGETSAALTMIKGKLQS
jgi:NACalpha-BTF3-like transcription factor